MESNWENVSEYSHGDKERKPNCFLFDTSFLQIKIHRHRDYPKDHWVVSCFTIGVDSVHLNHKDTEKAKLEALAYINGKLVEYSQARKMVEEEMKNLDDVSLGADE